MLRKTPIPKLARLSALAALVGLATPPILPVAVLGEPLQGRIEHVQKLPPVSRLLKPGIHYNDIANLPQSNAWVRVPAWLAGTWSVREEMAVYREDFKSGRSSTDHNTFTAQSKFSYGKQVDKTGQVWHYIGVPYTSDTAMPGMIEYHQVKQKELLQQSDHRVAVRAKVLVIKVRKSNGEITQTYQQESIAWYKPNPDGTISMESSTKAFDAAGNALSVTQNRARIHRFAPFKVVDEEYGKNLKALFRQYLLSQNLASLLPDQDR